MNKKVRHKVSKTLGLLLLLSSSLPFSLAYAETVEEAPTSETTISTMADDPLKDKTESTTDHVPTIEEDKEETQTTTSETTSTEETKTTESSTEDSTKKKPKPKPFGGGIGIQTVNLIEGVDIDADFAQLLRTDKSTTNNGGAWSGFGKAQDQLTDDDMAALDKIKVDNKSLTSINGIEYAVNLTELQCSTNQLSTLNVSQNVKLTFLDCSWNPLTSLDVGTNVDLEEFHTANTQINSLDLSQNVNLEILSCSNNPLLTSLNLSNNGKLKQLYCEYNPSLTVLDLSSNVELTSANCGRGGLTTLITAGADALQNLSCNNSKLVSLDVSQNTNLRKLDCSFNRIVMLELPNTSPLYSLNCRSNQISRLDLKNNISLRTVDCSSNILNSFLITGATDMEELKCDANYLSTLNVSLHKKLKTLRCGSNRLTSLITSGADLLESLSCERNSLTTLNIQQNTNLQKLECFLNNISDLTFAYGVTSLKNLDASDQLIVIPVPTVTGGQCTVDILKTTASAGLSATNSNVSPAPTFSYNGDDIVLSGVTPFSLESKEINFLYDGSQLTEAANPYTNKKFSGTITFLSVSNLSNSIRPQIVKHHSGSKVSWIWDFECITTKSAVNIKPKLVLPPGLTLVPGSVKYNGSPINDSDLSGTNPIGGLSYNFLGSITFDTIAVGIVDDWLEVEGHLDWEDDTIVSPHHNESRAKVQIFDDELTYTPKDNKDIALHSVPIYFNHGTHEVMTTAQTYHLHPMNYQSNTNVVTDGFYTRVKDDRTTSTGWKLTAKLSEFRDSGNQVMPNGAGTSLKLENMTIERVTDRDTPQEVIDPTPSGADVPSNVTATETLVAGQATAKTLVHAQVNEGRETWQLRMPFDKVSLNVPANAGKKATRYRARLTWSLDDTL